MAAAFCLGASAVQVGTRFIVANECTASDNYKDKVLKAKDTSTMITGNSTGHPVRVLKNKFAKQLKKMEDENLPPEEFERLGAGALKKAVVDGDVDNGSVMAGQIAGLVSERQSAKEIILDIVCGCEKIIGKMTDEFSG